MLQPTGRNQTSFKIVLSFAFDSRWGPDKRRDPHNDSHCKIVGGNLVVLTLRERTSQNLSQGKRNIHVLNIEILVRQK